MKLSILLSSLLVVVFTVYSFAKTKNQEPKENMFSKMRNMSLNIKPDQLNLNLPEGDTVVFGMVMDMSMGNVVATLSSFKTGDASMYLSSGALIIGGGQHDNVKKSAIGLITKSQEFLSQANKTELNFLPEKDYVNFYFLTNKGTYIIKEKMSNLENKTSKVLDLFLEANMVLTQLRITTEK